MPIPTRADGQLSEIDDLHNVILVRLRVLQHAGAKRDVGPIRDALKAYVDAVMFAVNGEPA